MFIAALPTIAKVWKEPKCPSTDEWIKKMWCIAYVHIYTHTHTHNEILLGDQKECNLALCNNVDGTRVHYAKRNKSEKDKYHDFTHMCNLRYKTNEHKRREAKII